jgi:hypothetical protein
MRLGFEQTITIILTRSPSDKANMSHDPDRWKIRFGQIFQALLNASSKKLEDYLYFMPDGASPDPKKPESYDQIDLHVNRDLYVQYFAGDTAPIQPVDAALAHRLNATLVLVSGFGHHLLAEQKPFGDQIPPLEHLGFTVVYARYDDSFESNEKCARRVYRAVKRDTDDRENLIFLTYSKGSSVLLELLSTPTYADVMRRTRAVVSFAGGLQGAALASSAAARAAVRLLNAYKTFSRPIRFYMRALHRAIRGLARLGFPFFKGWNELLDLAERFADDLHDLPDGITDLMRDAAREDYAHVRLPASIALFSLSAVYPESEFEAGPKSIASPEDLVLYIAGHELYRYNVFNDLQLLLPDSHFFKDNGTIVDLGIVKADHFGMTHSYIFSPRYIDPFPRAEMLYAVLLTLDEYFSHPS